MEKQRLYGKENGDLRSYMRANLRLYRTVDGGRTTKVGSGYRPNFDIRHDHDESPLVIAPGGAQVEVESGNAISPGGEGHVRLRPLYPESWMDIAPGQLLYAREGAKIIGEAEVIEIVPPG